MQTTLAIEDIQERRRRQGIEDVELEDVIRNLSTGDQVLLTLSTTVEGLVGEMLLVRITSIRGRVLRGKVVKSPLRGGQPHVQPGTVVTFNRTHIHSVPGTRAATASRFSTEGPIVIPKAKSASGVTPKSQAKEKPLTMEECLQQITALVGKIDGYAQYINQIATLPGTSTETKEKAVFAFHERLLFLERHLARIQEDLQLG